MKLSLWLMSLMTLLLASGVALAGTTLYDGASDTTLLASNADYTVTASGSVYNITKGAAAAAGASLVLGTANSGGPNSVNTQDYTITFVTGPANTYPASGQGLNLQPRLVGATSPPGITQYRLPRMGIIDTGGTFYALLSNTYTGPIDATQFTGRVALTSRGNVGFRWVYSAAGPSMTCFISTNGLAGPWTQMGVVSLPTISYSDTSVTPPVTVSYSSVWLDLNASFFMVMDPNGTSQTVSLDSFEMIGNDVANINVVGPPVPQATPSASAPTLGMWGIVALGICLLAIAFTAMGRRAQGKA